MKIRKAIKRVARMFGYDIVGRNVVKINSGLSEDFLPGDFYSVIPSAVDLKKYKYKIFSKKAGVYPVELNTESQILTLNAFRDMKEEPPFYSQEKRARFNIDNFSFSYDDAPILHYMMRMIRPKRIIEIGSGNSSACMLDTSERYLDDQVKFTFIDINCQNLRKNLFDNDFERIDIIEQPVQEVDICLFRSLQANDMLFVDSSHVMKAGSDLSTIIFDILTILAPGVVIHFHDVRYPFQYEENSVLNGAFWNEAYILRAFLMYNDAFGIIFWLNYLVNNVAHPNETLSFLPLSDWSRRFNSNSQDFSGAGGSIYIRKKP